MFLKLYKLLLRLYILHFLLYKVQILNPFTNLLLINYQDSSVYIQISTLSYMISENIWLWNMQKKLLQYYISQFKFSFLWFHTWGTCVNPWHGETYQRFHYTYFWNAITLSEYFFRGKGPSRNLSGVHSCSSWMSKKV